jgi:hypothetical protein
MQKVKDIKNIVLLSIHKNLPLCSDFKKCKITALNTREEQIAVS